MRRRVSRFRLGLIIAFGFLAGCSNEKASPQPGSSAKPAPPIRVSKTAPAAPLTPEQRIEAGRGAYNANCIACHSVDPTTDGALGPAVAGSSLSLIEARVLRAEYPEGYKPKRDTRVMVALPHLKPRLAELAAYLDSLQ